MPTSNIEQSDGFRNAQSVLREHGLKVSMTKSSVIVSDDEDNLKDIFDSLTQFYEYAKDLGANIDPGAAEPRTPRHDTSNSGSGPKSVEPLAEPPSANADPAAAASSIDEFQPLRQEVSRLRGLGKKAVAQRDDWERRALAAEARADQLTISLAASQSGRTDKRFDQLRRLLAHEFHPDHAQTEGIEKIVRAEIFKGLWPRIEEIARSEAGEN